MFLVTVWFSKLLSMEEELRQLRLRDLRNTRILSRLRSRCSDYDEELESSFR